MSVKKLPPTSFEDPNGATVTVPADKVALYSVIKSDQLRVLNRILSDHATGFEIELHENDVYALAGLASELAHACDKFMSTLAGAVRVSRESVDVQAENGGAA